MKKIMLLALFMLLVVPSVFADGLKIRDLRLSVDYDEAYTYRLERKDRVDFVENIGNGTKVNADILPGSNLTFTFWVENSFQSNGPKINHATSLVTIENIDDGADLEDESDSFDLKPGDDIRIDVTFGVPLDVESSTYDVTIEAKGDEDQSNSHKTIVKFQIEVKKQSHDIRITRVSLIPSTVTCDRKATISASIMNLGSNSETDMALEFKSINLGINSYDTDISLEEADQANEEAKTYSKPYTFQAPSFLNPGNYPITINLYWKKYVLFDQKTAILSIKDCNTKKNTGKKNETNVEVKVPINNTKNNASIVQNENQDEIITATQESEFSTFLPFMILFGGVMIIILLIAITIAYFRTRKKGDEDE